MKKYEEQDARIGETVPAPPERATAPTVSDDAEHIRTPGTVLCCCARCVGRREQECERVAAEVRAGIWEQQVHDTQLQLWDAERERDDALKRVKYLEFECEVLRGVIGNPMKVAAALLKAKG